MPLYCGVNGVRHEITELYTGIGGVRKDLTEMWAAEGGVKKLIYQAGTRLGDLSVGKKVKIKENGNFQEYLVVHQGKPSSMYDASCDGTWLVRDILVDSMQWDSDNANDFTSASILSFLNNYHQNFESTIRNVIKNVKIPYYTGRTNNEVISGANGYSCKCFLLSATELGTEDTFLLVDGSKLSYFSSNISRRAYNKSGSRQYWWTRSGSRLTFRTVFKITDTGELDFSDAEKTSWVRPAMIMPKNLLVADDMTILV